MTIQQDIQHFSSRCVGWIAQRQRPKWLIQGMIRWFATTYSIDLNEASYPVSSYKSLGEFFTRSLKSDCRPISTAPVVSPTDGVVIATGYVDNGTILQVKGRPYSVAELLGDSADGYKTYATIYLSPRDCHRIFSPIDGTIKRLKLIKGCLYPVRMKQLETIPHLYCRNERLITFFETEDGNKLVLVAVGALNVGSMSTPYDASALPLNVAPGQWIKTFHLGSTVVILDSRRLQLPDLGPIQYGASLFR